MDVIWLFCADYFFFQRNYVLLKNDIFIIYFNPLYSCQKAADKIYIGQILKKCFIDQREIIFLFLFHFLFFYIDHSWLL